MELERCALISAHSVWCFLVHKKRCVRQLSNRFLHPNFFQLKTALTSQKYKLPLGCRGLSWSWVMKRMYVSVEVLLPADPHYLYHTVEWLSSFLTMLPWKVGIEPAILEYSTKISFETIWLGRLWIKGFVCERNWKFQFSCSYASVPSVLSVSHYTQHTLDSLTETQLSRQWTWTKFLHSLNHW